MTRWWRLRTPGRFRALASFLLLALVGAVCLAAARHAPASGASHSLVGTKAPATSGRTLSGTRFSLADLRGRFVLVNIWASWCGPCKDELPLLRAELDQPRYAGVVLAGIDVKDPGEAARPFLRKVGLPASRQLSDPDGTLAVAWGARGVPETYLVGPDGRILAEMRGIVDRHWLRTAVLPRVATS